MRKNYNEGSKYSDRVIEFIATRGPSADFWFFSMLFFGTIWFVWYVLKVLGYFNTPLWVLLIGAVASVVTIISGLTFTVEKIREWGRNMGNVQTRLTHVESVLEKFDDRLVCVEKQVND